MLLTDHHPIILYCNQKMNILSFSAIKHTISYNTRQDRAQSLSFDRLTTNDRRTFRMEGTPVVFYFG